MKQLTKISIGVLLLAISVLSVKQSNERAILNVNLQNLLHINQALAESGEDCSSFGYKDSNQYGYTLDGYDCDCNEKEDVKTECND